MRPGFPYIFQRFEVTHLPALWRSGTPPGAAVSSPCDRQSGTRRGGRCPEPRAGLRHARGWEKGGSEPLRSRKITNGSCYLHFCLCVCVGVCVCACVLGYLRNLWMLKLLDVEFFWVLHDFSSFLSLLATSSALSTFSCRVPKMKCQSVHGAGTPR